MRDTSSQHIEPLRALPRHYFPLRGIRFVKHPDDFVYRPAIDLAALVELLRISHASDASMPVDKGKKRATAPVSLERGGKQKRVKLSESAITKINSNVEEFSWATMCYPKLQAKFSSTSAENIAVLTHTFEIHFTTSIPSDPMVGHFADDDSWVLDEENFKETLALLGEEPEFDLGGTGFAMHSGRIVVVSEVLQEYNGGTGWLFLLPAILDGIDGTTLGIGRDRYFGSGSNQDIMMTCAELQADGRVAINGQLKLVLPPAEAAEDVLFALKAEITTRVKWTAEDAQRRLIQYLYPDPVLAHSESVTNIPFFYSRLGSAPDIVHLASDRAMQPEALLATLLPFQRRSVAWLLDQEGKSVTPNGKVVDKPANFSHFSFWESIEEGNQTFYTNRLTGNLNLEVPDEPAALGGILAEEPGLGKTLEIISLLLLNPAGPDRHPGIRRWDPETNVEVKAVKTTLIVTPPALASQWMDEFEQHAPSLKVLLYEGWNRVMVPITTTDVEKERIKRLRAKTRGQRKSKSNKTKGKDKKLDPSNSEDDPGEYGAASAEDVGEIVDWCSYVQEFDAVIVTYSTLRTDVNVARAPPKRPRREDVIYSNIERPRSPLILVEWNRVVMDEVQMVGGGHVEDMVSMIPRLASFAVSGTPARTQVSDLSHVLKFLRVDHIVGSPRHWTRLITPGYSGHFSAFFQSLAIRTTKASVKAELTIPQQTRFLVGVEMGAVERHVYDQNFETVLLELGLDARGVDVRGMNLEPDAAKLRTMIRRLRAICTHPQIGQLGPRHFKQDGGALKTVEQVLQSMRYDNWGLVLDDCKTKAGRVLGVIRMAQLQQQGFDKDRYQRSLETLLMAEKEITQLIEEIESTISTHEAQRPHRTEETESAAKKSTLLTDKGKERQRSLSPLSEVESEKDDDDNLDMSAAKEHRTRQRVLKNKLRDIQLVMHRVKFLQGDVYHMLGESHSAAENAAYEEAESIRRAVLKTSEQEANNAMISLAKDVTLKGLTAGDLQIEVPFLDYRFKDESLQEEANEIIENVLNQQSSLLWEWRTRLTELLTRKVTPENEADGQEYQRTLDDQGEAEIYLINYASILADRREAILKERTVLAAHDAREKLHRHTNVSRKAAVDAPTEILDGAIELQPEHEVLFKELSVQRKALLSRLGGRALKSAAVDMATKMARIHQDGDLEKVTLKAAVTDLRQLITDQGDLLDKLEADLALYRKAFNQRILYFRQLQEISDAVSDVVFEGTVAQALQECVTEQRDLSAKINTSRARQRYLDHLSKLKAGAEEDEDEQVCILCKCEFVRGDAHVFCEDCMKLWISSKTSSTCPVCRVAINFDKLERFAVTEQPLQPLNVESEHEVPKSRRKIEYNMIDCEVFHEIQSMPAYGDYGNKIQTLVRHLLYLRNADAGAKSIVFSAWADSLFIVERALRANGISCLRVDQNRKGLTAAKRFASEDIDVLLLHGEKENAGLNITCASRVFLLESVVHHGFEIQAIARIDRMGQTRPTEVFCYYAEDTVEKNILDLAARHGTSIYTKDHAVGSILNVASLAGEGNKNIDSPSKKTVQKGDFIFKIDDMMAILFPHMFEDIEYLVPAGEMDATRTAQEFSCRRPHLSLR
ncbi:SNF2 family N-terminal domain-containing protein [Mycena pura]|uniref:SNF2 family N-terminal domain-containing protein n=1 Tax=Mycena pura TaxID=153505 RepID=A0AAD7E2B6_9AGAR|nr:SNF2 family N-terminal domain-containing protein [Mycena pura]